MCNKCLHYRHPKNIAKDRKNITQNFAVSLQEEHQHECRETNCFYYKKNYIKESKEKCNEYRKELNIMKIMIEKKCDTYEAKGIQGYRIGKTYAETAKDNLSEETRC